MIDKGLVSGSTTLIILSLLKEKDMYGYEMIDTLSKCSENVFELKTGTLYPLLHQLEKSEDLSSYENQINGKKRKYYQLTPKGRRFLEFKTKEWKLYAETVEAILRGVSYEY